MRPAILIAGIGQLVLVLMSLAIPRVLAWEEETRKLKPLTRQVFWTYAGYIWFTNLSFGLVSTFLPDALLDGSTLAAAVTSFIGIYWGVRVFIQFFWFDRSDVPSGRGIRIAESLLVSLFVSLTCVYGLAASRNLVDLFARH